MGGMILRVMGAAAVAVALATGGALACAAPSGVAGLRSDMVARINAARRDNGLPALATSKALQTAATGHACDMAKRGYFAHSGPGGPSFTARIKRAGYRYRSVNENIARLPNADADAAAQIWRNSPPHWANILDRSVREVGLGIAQAADGRVYWVMNAGSR